MSDTSFKPLTGYADRTARGHRMRSIRYGNVQDFKSPSVYSAALVAMLSAATATAADSSLRDPQAESRLKEMSDFMGQLSGFSVDALVSDERIMADGFKLSALRAGTLKIQRPDKFFFEREGLVHDQAFYFDGEQLGMLANRLGLAVELPVSGDIEAALDTLTLTLGAELPARDLVSADLYKPLMEPVQESAALGVVEINGVACRQLAFRTDEVDWQIWIAEDDQPLPCRYTITSKWVSAAPQFTVTFSDWQINPSFTERDFQMAIPAGIETVDVEAFVEKLSQEEAPE